MRAALRPRGSPWLHAAHPGARGHGAGVVRRPVVHDEQLVSGRRCAGRAAIECHLEVRRPAARRDDDRDRGRVHRPDSVSPAAMPRVLVVHNRYRIAGGEERSVELQLRALRRAGVAHALFERRSAEAGRAGAARALLRGGRDESELAAAVRASAPTWCTCTTCFRWSVRAGSRPRARRAPRVVMHLHNVRLFCAIGVGARDGGPCFRCHGRCTLPGLVLNCRGSLPEAAAYAAALARHQPAVFAAVDRFVAPEPLRRGPAGAASALPRRAARVPAALPAGRGVCRALRARPRAATRWWPPGSRRRRAPTLAVAAAARAGVPLRDRRRGADGR